MFMEHHIQVTDKAVLSEKCHKQDSRQHENLKDKLWTVKDRDGKNEKN